jgi:hypothetical protein
VWAEPERHAPVENSVRATESIMTDDKSKTGPPDRDRINLTEDYEVRYWSDKFGVSDLELQAAVEKVGPMVKNVSHFLGK